MKYNRVREAGILRLDGCNLLVLSGSTVSPVSILRLTNRDTNRNGELTVGGVPYTVSIVRIQFRSLENLLSSCTFDCRCNSAYSQIVPIWCFTQISCLGLKAEHWTSEGIGRSTYRPCYASQSILLRIILWCIALPLGSRRS